LTDNEESVLACLLADAASVPLVVPWLEPADFPTVEARRIYQAISEAHAQGLTLDVGLVSGKTLVALALLKKIAGLWVSSANVLFYVRSLRAERTVKAVSQAVEGSHLGGGVPHVKIEENVREALSREPVQPSETVDVRDRCGAVVREALADRDWAITGRETGFPLIDKKIDGIHNGDYVVIGARTSIGKTALALGMAARWARQEPCLYVTYEMPVDGLVIRLLAASARVDSQAIRQGRLTAADRSAIERANGEISSLELLFEESQPTISELEAILESQVKKQASPIFVDYLQLIRPDRGTRNTTYEHVSECSGRLRVMSKRLNVPIVALSQLRRTPDDRLPMMSELKESGSIEQDADIVLLLHRERSAEGLSMDAELAVAKNRYGDVGAVRLVFNGPLTTFGPA